ncbi:MAG: Hsp33 family molecular chaperone HslO [Firmicutes bacterium]|nr:Hsp33 family molecular chaperone HslO [Bacillota bacterium]
MSDCIIRATAAGQSIRAFACDLTETAEEARRRHGTSPVVTAALGRLLAACAMMGSGMKGEDDLLTLMIRSNGPIQGLTVTADSHGNIKGYPLVPDVEIPRKGPGKLDVGSAVGSGTLTVIQDLGLKEPYSGQIELQTGEIAEDLAYYFTVSEQTPSAVGLGVMVDTDCTVKHAGGFILQLMPDTPEEVIAALEKKLADLPQVTSLMEQGLGPEEILTELVGDLGFEITERLPVRFFCNCSEERIAAALATLKDSDLQEMIDDGETIEVKCHFCNSAYHFTVEQLKEILAARK